MKSCCHRCATEVAVTPNSGNYKLVQGWVQFRTAGGANKVTLPKDADLYMCRHCMDKERMGLHPGQEGLPI